MTAPDEVEELVRLFEGVAQAEGWQPGAALRLWVPRSIYFALAMPGPGGPEAPFIGGLQLVLPDAAGGLPCHELWPEVALEGAVSPTRSTGRHLTPCRCVPSRCAHIAMLAVEAGYRGQSLLFWSLAVEMWRTCVGEGISTLYIEVTPRVLPIYHRLGWPLQVCGALRRHWGEDCYLCTLGIPEVAHALLQRAEHSPYYREIIAQAFRVTLSQKEDPARDMPVAAAG